jgi:hypothetical protein
MKPFLTFAIWSFCSVAFAQVEAIIVAPDKALPGELVVLNSSKSKGDNHKWITPEGISTAQAGCTAIDSQVFFATPRAGSYTFYLIVSDKSASIDYAKHTVVIGDSASPPTPGPIQPVPQPGNPGDFAKLTQISRANSLALNDPKTRASLAASLKPVVAQLKSLCDANQCPTLAAAQSRFIGTMEAVLLARPRGESRDANWEEVWRLPNAKFISDSKITSVAKGIEAYDAIVKGLE